jgi:phage virion morphogenesis protein
MLNLTLDRSAFDKRIGEALSKASDMSQPFAVIGEIALSAIEENFQAEGRYEYPTSPLGGGKKWQELAPATKASLIGGRKGYTKKGVMRKPAARRLANHKILQGRGRLAASLSRRSGRNFAQVGSNVIYARIHQYGGMAGRGKRVRIPARPYLNIQAVDLAEMKQVIIAHLSEV